jgi:hypothetical protein
MPSKRITRSYSRNGANTNDSEATAEDTAPPPSPTSPGQIIREQDEAFANILQQQLEQEAEKKRKEQMAAERKRTVPPEPAADSDDVVHVRFHTHTERGTIMRRFGPDTEVRVMYAFLEAETGHDPETFEISSVAPNQSLPFDSKETLEQAGITGRVVLHVSKKKK